METARDTTLETTDIETKKVDPAGDVIFLVQNKMRVLVSSKILSLASTVFAAMLGERFVEGQQLSVTSPPQIELPEDDADTMWLMCRLLHHQVRVKEERSSSSLVRLAVLAYKYDCLQSLSPIIKSGVDRWEHLYKETIKEYGRDISWEMGITFDRFIVSYLLQDISMFRKASTKLVMCSEESFLEFWDFPGLTVLPTITFRTWDPLSSQRVY